uniref:protein-ribulosamine 3-kinase n=1 Tax=Balaenoptera musculus TaxID=9771 RepID=A0A8C0E3W6_BALMU
WTHGRAPPPRLSRYQRAPPSSHSAGSARLGLRGGGGERLPGLTEPQPSPSCERKTGRPDTRALGALRPHRPGASTTDSCLGSGELASGLAVCAVPGPPCPRVSRPPSLPRPHGAAAARGAAHRDPARLREPRGRLHQRGTRLRHGCRSRVHQGQPQDAGQRAEGAGPQYVTKFGFHTVTCCGFIPQVNDWQDDWPTFFTQHRLQAQLDLIEKDYADREARELWSQLQVKIPDLFCGLEIVPALLHGDLWSGNVAEDDTGPIIYDPASFYGHSEFELAIALMFGGFPRPFFTAYHRKVPKAPGFDRRLLLYQLFNYLNHWNHFGKQYRSPSLGTMRKLLK